MRLVIVLRLLVRKHDVERDVITLIHHGPMARHHAPDVKTHDAWHSFEPLVGTRDQFIDRVRLLRISPKNDNM